MDLLKRMILEVGIIQSKDVIRLDAILNHQVNPRLTMEMGKEFASRFRHTHIDKVLTIESSGIPIAFATALEIGVPLVFARRKKTLTTDEDTWSERVPSFTKGIVTDIMVSKSFLQKGERILVVDDIIANGDAARGLIRIIRRAGAEICGMGIAVEKTFQSGGRSIREEGVRVESLVKIASLDQGRIVFE
jgi:xanthine phosphoribosyltransferase